MQIHPKRKRLIDADVVPAERADTAYGNVEAQERRLRVTTLLRNKT
jgi:hypothetical protein